MLKIPPNSCDTHMHVYDSRFALDPRWTAPPPTATAADYRQVQRKLGLERVVVVQPNAYVAPRKRSATWGPTREGLPSSSPTSQMPS